MPEHLQQRREHLNGVVRKDLFQLLLKYEVVFARNDMSIGRTDLVLHDIDTGDAPVRQPPHRVPNRFTA